jgi:AhpD family alkylhydroperoxidase
MQVQAERLRQVDPANVERAMRAMLSLGSYQAHSGLEPSLLELVKLRASQINGCAYCLDMHTKDARARGRASSASTCSTPGARAPSTASENGRR